MQSTVGHINMEMHFINDVNEIFMPLHIACSHTRSNLSFFWQKSLKINIQHTMKLVASCQ